MPSPAAPPTNIEIVAVEPSPLGLLCLRRRTLLSDDRVRVTEISLDGEQLMSDLNCESEKALACESLSRHGGSALRVLVGGLGLGITAAEVLRSDRVASVEVVEYLPAVIAWFQEDLLPLSAGLRQDERFVLVQGDVFDVLNRELSPRWDVLLIDVDHSPDEPLGSESAAFYSPAGLLRVKRTLHPGGLLAVWSSAPSDSFAAALREAYRHVWILPVPYRDRSEDDERTDWLFLAAA